MNVFISWSGPRSQQVALKLREWLPIVIQSVKPWMSKEDIDAGARWNAEISKQLETSSFGIVCVTKSNQSKPWIMFEAGAIAKALDGTRVVPYLIDLDPPDIEPGPLSQFQAKRANKNDTFQMLVSLNKSIGSPLTEEQLRHIFDKFWPELEEVLTNLPDETTQSTPARTSEDILAEVLVLVRQMAQTNESRERVIGYPRWKSKIIPFSSTSYTPAAKDDIINWFWSNAELDNLMFVTAPHARADALVEFMHHALSELGVDTDTFKEIFWAVLKFYNEKHELPLLGVKDPSSRMRRTTGGQVASETGKGAGKPKSK